jgi:hypothetical protein
VGPIEYLVIGFEGNQFTGEIAPELAALRDAGTIRVLDLVVIGRDREANVFVAEVTEIPDMQQHIDIIQDDLGQWFSQEDIDSIADDIDAGDTVALLLIEHLWAEPLADSIRRANGSLLAQTYIPGELVDQVRSLLQNGARPDNAAPPDEYRRAA